MPPPPRPTTAVPRIVNVENQLRNDEMRWWGMFATMVGATFFTGLVAFTTMPRPFAIAFVAFAAACGAALVRPTIGVYLIVVLTLLGDPATTAWWPFFKNMSSRESLMFVNDQLILSPLEVLGMVTILAWFLRRLVDPTWTFRRGRLFWPLIVFSGFVLFGVLRGRSTGGDTRVAIFEFRPLLYMILVYFLVTNLLERRRQYQAVLLLSFVAVSIQSIFSLVYYRGLPAAERESLESLTEHSATIHMNALFVFFLAVMMLRCRARYRWSMALLSVPVVYAYLLSQRRAAMVALFVGVIIVLVAVWNRRRRMFWFVTPVLTVLGLGLVLGTWNAEGAIGLPAQAVKTVLFPEQLSGADQSSNLYRDLEKFDLWFTIRQNPIFGIGFGQKFYMPYRLPDISFFEFWEYMPHNAVLWVWLKLGFFGFATMFFLFGRAVQLGGRAMVSVRTDEQAAAVITGVAYVMMFIVFAYVDIAWGPRSTVFLGFTMALCADYLDAEDPVAVARAGIHRHQLDSVR